nr:unnamed protein product [Callosobruchus analis]
MTIKFSLNYVANIKAYYAPVINILKTPLPTKNISGNMNNYDIPNLMKYNDASSDNTEEITNYFKEFFSSVYTNTNSILEEEPILIDV